MSESRKIQEFERALQQSVLPEQEVELRLFVAGMGSRSTQAIADLWRLCQGFGEHMHMEVVDIYETPATAKEEQVVAVPTLVRERPLPRRKLIGALDDLARVARQLDLAPPGSGGAA